MAIRRTPALFISHGGPPLAIDTKDFLHPFFKQQLPKMLPAAPRAIVVVSAHYEKANFRVTNAARPRTIHDFGGFSPKLYQLTYPAPGDPQLATRIVSMIKAAGLSSEEDDTWGFDHGSWIPLYLMYPKAEVPVLQVSITKDFDAQKMLALGKALRPLRDEGILLIGSGSTTHNLYEAEFGDVDAPVEPWAAEFTAWVHKSAALPGPEREAALLQFAKQPTFRRAHPREEHWVPIFFALGAADAQEKVQVLADRILYGSLAASTLLWE